MRKWTTGALLVATAAMAAGCQPPEMMPVAPPGLEVARIPTTPQGEGAQAIGEQPAATTRQNKVATRGADSPPTPVGQSTKTASGLVYETLKEGTGPAARSGQSVTIHYTGTLADGKVFDSSRTKGKPFQTAIGVGQVIPGWDEGVPGMKVGERRKLTIPPELGYGAAGSPPVIPGGATLIFDVELLDAK
jgi:FKBP-type peptidyl-prolyl cis-trans isomerase